jgi:N6-adenosine-specific RNA methylase IME4
MDNAQDSKTVVKYKTIMADPPWYQAGGGKSKRGADRHYPLMKEQDIKKTMESVLHGKVDDNAHLYLWVANNHLPEALRVIDHLGFRYITNIVWAKTHFGLGRYFRGQHELCLFATKGRGFSVRKDVNNISSLVGKSLIKPTRHSSKPKQIYELVENRSEGPYLELFARSKHPGWDCWGNEII